MNELDLAEPSTLYNDVHATWDLLEAQFTQGLLAERVTEEDVLEETANGITRHTLRRITERLYG